MPQMNEKTATNEMNSARSSQSTSTKTTISAAMKQPTHEEIAQRAYSIYLSHQAGNSLDHWAQAERELSKVKSNSVS